MTDTPDPGTDEKGLSYVEQINDAYAAVLKAEANSLNARIKLGELLKAAKDAVGHGAFGPWLKKHCSQISHRSANIYMKLAKLKDKLDERSNSQRAAILASGGEMSVRRALKEIRTPDEIKKDEEKAAKAKETKKTKGAPPPPPVVPPLPRTPLEEMKALALFPAHIGPEAMLDMMFDTLKKTLDHPQLTELCDRLLTYLDEPQANGQAVPLTVQ